MYLKNCSNINHILILKIYLPKIDLAQNLLYIYSKMPTKALVTTYALFHDNNITFQINLVKQLS